MPFCFRFLIIIALFFQSNIVFSQTKLPNTFLWKISGNGLENPSYLYGTIHLTDKRVFYFGDSLYAALENSKGFAAELNMDSLAEYSINTLFKLPTYSKLVKDVLDKKTFNKIQRKLSKKIGKKASEITIADIKAESYKSVKESYKKGGMSGFMDAHLYSIAKNQGKWTGGVEDLEDQMGLLNDEDNLDPEYILKMAFDDDTKFLENLINTYINQDLEAVANLYGGELNSFSNVFINKRNIKMASRMDSLAKVRSSLFAVGVAHLPGEKGVIELLKQKGYTVEPVFSSKKIAPEEYTYTKVDNKWFINYDEDSTYSFKTPSKANLVPLNGLPMNLYMYLDLGTTTGYYFLDVSSGANDVTNKDSVFQTLSKSIVEKSKAEKIESKHITYKGMDGLESINYSETEDTYIRLKIFIASSKIYLIQFSNRSKEECYGTNAELFFNSLEIYNKTIQEKTNTFTDSNFLFTIKIPGKELKDKSTESANENDDSWKILSKTFINYQNLNIYVFAAKETKPSFYIPSDTLIFSSYISELKENTSYSDLEFRYGTFKNLPALFASAKLKDENYHLRTINFLNGNRNFVLVGMFLMNDSSSIINYFNSFNLITTPPTTAYWSKQTIDTVFSCLAPIPFVLKDTLAYRTNENYISYDKYTTASYSITKDIFGKYESFDSDTAMLSSFIKDNKLENDSLLNKEIKTSKDKIEANFLLASPNTYNYKNYQIQVLADTVFTLYEIVPKTWYNSKQTNAFFSSFKPVYPSTTPITVLNDKIEQFFKDIVSTDSATKENAISGFYNMHFSRKHLPLLHSIINENPPVDSLYYSSPYYYASNALANLSDSITVDFIKNNYDKKNEDFDKANWIGLLFRMDNKYADTIAKKILLSKPPLKGSIEDLEFYIKADSGKNVYFIKQLLPLTNNSSSWAYTLARATKELMDSNYVSKKDLLIYENNFIKEARRRLAENNAKDSFDFSCQYYGLIDLLKTYNTAASNKVLQEYLQSKHLELLFDAAEMLINNNQPVAAGKLQKIAADDIYRSMFYEFLKEQKKLYLFPKEYATQKLLAKSYLKNSGDDEEISDIIFLKEKTHVYKGIKQRFYLFKIKYNNDDKYYLGISGGWHMNTNKLEFEDDISGGYYEKEFDENKVDAFFLEYIESLSNYGEEAEKVTEEKVVKENE